MSVQKPISKWGAKTILNELPLSLIRFQINNKESRMNFLKKVYIFLPVMLSKHVICRLLFGAIAGLYVQDRFVISDDAYLMHI